MSLSPSPTVGKFQTTLHTKAKNSPDCRFYALYDKIYRRDVLAFAYERCRANGGAPGIDGQSFADLESSGNDRWLDQLAEELREETYHPRPVRRVYIAKGDGKQRPLGIFELYGPMVGGRAYPINLPFEFVEGYLTGIEPRNLDLGKLLEETLLWFAMASSGVVIGFAHAEPGVPIAFNEIDLLLYEAAGDFTGLQDPPVGGWDGYLARHSVCLMEFTIGHHPEVSKEGQARQETGSGKDVPKNKLMNFYALRSFGFRLAHGHYFTVTGESNLAPSTKRTLNTTVGFRYRCLSEECVDDIGQMVLNHPDAPVPWDKIRSWHAKLLEMVEAAGSAFRAGL